MCSVLLYNTSKVSYQDDYSLVVVYTHGDFLVLHHWQNRLQALWRDIPFGQYYPDIEQASHCSILLRETYALIDSDAASCTSQTDLRRNEVSFSLSLSLSLSLTGPNL